MQHRSENKNRTWKKLESISIPVWLVQHLWDSLKSMVSSHNLDIWLLEQRGICRDYFRIIKVDMSPSSLNRGVACKITCRNMQRASFDKLLPGPLPPALSLPHTNRNSAESRSVAPSKRIVQNKRNKLSSVAVNAACRDARHGNPGNYGTASHISRRRVHNS